MIIQPRVRGFISVSAHPLGCAAHVRQQIAYVQARAPLARGPARVLVIGASTGYGLAARIAAAFGARAATLGVFLEREGTAERPATAGWYNSAAFEQAAHADGLYARSINGDAFSDAVKQRTIDTLRADLGQVDLVIYSLASPRRTHPVSGRVFMSTLKPIGQPLQARTIDTDRQVLRDTVLEPATPEEIEGTIAVMGGEDWQMWIAALGEAGVLAPGAKTSAFTYLGDEITRAIYWDGSIGAAKKDLDLRVQGIRDSLSAHGGDARVSVLKALVTQASAAIPMMPLYLSLLFKAMKEQGTHEGCIEQVVRLFETGLYGAAPQLDAEGRLRVDDLELDPRVQQRVQALWQQVSDDNLRETTDFAGYQADFLRLFGFGFDGIDYGAEVDPVVPLPGVVQVA